MSFLAKRELLTRVVPRYRTATPPQESVTLDEFVAVTNYARKYASGSIARNRIHSRMYGRRSNKN